MTNALKPTQARLHRCTPDCLCDYATIGRTLMVACENPPPVASFTFASNASLSAASEAERGGEWEADREISLLRRAVVTYGDRQRMATVHDMSLQQAIDRAFENTGDTLTTSTPSPERGEDLREAAARIADSVVEHNRIRIAEKKNAAGGESWRDEALIVGIVERIAAAIRAMPIEGAGEFQARVAPWMQECFGPAISADFVERGDRFLEEALELLQSGGYDRDRVAQLVDYVWSRPVGEPSQEVGGVMVTLAAYCLAHDLNMHEAAETELTRIWTKVPQIRAKQAAKAATIGASPLPVAPAEQCAKSAQNSPPAHASESVRERVIKLDECENDRDVAYYWRQEAIEARSALALSHPLLSEVKEVLEPFAELVDCFVGEDEDDNDLYSPPLYEHQMRVRVGWLRRASALLAKLTGAE